MSLKDKVLIDARMVKEIPHGILRYVEAIGSSLEKIKNTSGLRYDPIFLVQDAYPFSSFYSFEIIRCQSRFLSVLESFEIQNKIQKIRPQLYHSPSFSSLWNVGCSSLITIHDLNHLSYGERLINRVCHRIYYEFLLRRFANQSEMILTVSEWSKTEILNWLRCPQEKVQVIYNAVFFFENFQEEVILKQYGLKSREYFLCMGHLKPHKNLILLDQAYSNYLKKNSEGWPLVGTVFSDPRLKHIRCVGAVSSEVGSVLLKNAAALFSPSLYEGFGLPVVEAASVGTAVVASRIPSHLEGLKDLKSNEVLWVSPKDQPAWENAFDWVQSGRLSGACLETQKKVLDFFSQKKFGQKINDVYQKALHLTD